MAGIPDWAQPPQLLEDDQERINRIASPAAETNRVSSIPEWAEPPRMVNEGSSAIPEWAEPPRMVSTPVETQDTPPEGLVGLPEGVEAFTYSENDLSDRP